MSKQLTANGTITRRSFLGATALGATALTLKGLEITSPEIALADEAEDVTYGYTTCNMCNQTPKCGLKATIKDGRIVRAEGVEDHPRSKPCVKGLSSVQALYDPNRLLYPMKRTNPEKSPDTDPGWERITWDEAYETIAAELNKAKETYGPDSVIFNVGDPKENLGVMWRLGSLFGSGNIDHGGCQCQYGLIIAGISTYANFLAATPTPDTKVHINWGTNPAWSDPYGYADLLDAKANGCKFIVVDTRLTPTAIQLADIFLQIRSGTDGALALAMGNVMIEEDLYDHEFVENWVEGFEEYKEYVQEFTPEKAEEITGAPADKIREAARLWATAGPGTLNPGSHATTHHTNGVQNQRAIDILISLAGNVDIPGGAEVHGTAFPFDTYCSTPDFILADIWDQNKDRRAGVDRWPVWSMVMRQTQNNGLPEYIDEGLIHAGVFLGSNVMVFPQTRVYQEAFAKLDFAVAIDWYIKPETHNVMDIMLPSAMCYERQAPFGNPTGDALFMNEVLVEPQGEAREDWKILLDLGCALGYEEECFGGDVEAAEEALLQTGTDATLADLRAALPGCYTQPNPEYTPKKYETGGMRADGQPGFDTPSGKVEFVSNMLIAGGFDGLPIYKEPNYSPISTPELFEEYPLVLTTGNRVPQYVHSKWRDIPWLNQFMPEPVVLMNPEDAEARGLVDGDDVRLFNQLGELQVKVAITNLEKPGAVEFLHGWAQANSCELIARDFDPISGFPPYKDAICQVEKL